MKFNIKRPCDNCPFRSDKLDTKGWLGAKRAGEIADYVLKEGKTFSCHKTLDNKMESHCAGALIFIETNIGTENNTMVSIARRLGLYDPTKLDLTSSVFKDKQAIIKHHTW